MTQTQIDDLQRQIQSVTDIEDISDGFHTFKSLYHQRLYLFAALVKAYKNLAWKSIRHHDGETCFGGGWFIVGITTPLGDYTYHYELKDWNLFDCKVLEKAPRWDGHTDADVNRVLSLNIDLVNQWIPVSQALPSKRKDPLVISRKVLVYCNGNFISAVYNHEDNVWVDEYNIEELEGVTHWMDVLRPPKD